MNKEKSPKLSAWKKELLQWAAILLVALTLYATGLHTEVIGKLQSVLLYTGIFQPDVEEPLAPNTTYADYTLSMRSLDSADFVLDEFRGQVIFLNIWATWCPPCIAEMPNIQRLYDGIDSDKVSFVMLSVDDDPDKAKKFIERKSFSFPVYSLRGRMPEAFQSPVVPTTFVIAPDGEIVMKHEGMAKYNTDSFKSFLLSLSDE